MIEILVSIMLMGTVVVASLTALRTSVNASALGRDHSNAHAWLQSATDVLYGSPRADCGTEVASRAADVRTEYLAAIRSTTNPEGWALDRIDITNVQFWDGESTYQSVCYDDSGVDLQLITLQVRAPDGRIIESVEVVKG